MKEKLKYILICTTVLFIVSILSAVFYYRHQYKNKENELKTHVKHINEIKEFQKTSEIESVIDTDDRYNSNLDLTNDDREEYLDNESFSKNHEYEAGGIDTSNMLYIENIEYLLFDFYDIEKHEKIKENIIEMLLIRIPKVLELDEDKQKKYFQENQGELFNKFGIDSYEDFKEYLRSIHYLKDKEISNVSIDTDSLKQLMEGVRAFDLYVTYADVVNKFKVTVIEDKDEELNIFNVMIK